QTCNTCGTQTRTVSCNTSTGKWNVGAWGNCSKTQDECVQKTCKDVLGDRYENEIMQPCERPQAYNGVAGHWLDYPNCSCDCPQGSTLINGECIADGLKCFVDAGLSGRRPGQPNSGGPLVCNGQQVSRVSCPVGQICTCSQEGVYAWHGAFDAGSTHSAGASSNATATGGRREGSDRDFVQAHCVVCQQVSSRDACAIIQGDEDSSTTASCGWEVTYDQTDIALAISCDDQREMPGRTCTTVSSDGRGYPTTPCTMSNRGATFVSCEEYSACPGGGWRMDLTKLECQCH
ncbi:MAG: hypothetical protein IJ876_00005, partial [Elusimicrobiaceae bacterium]|nr:hypothetical protein [Elusimicrobiaceae bacterium]